MTVTVEGCVGGKLPNSQKQLVLVTNERICQKIDLDRPFRLNFFFGHSVYYISQHCIEME